MHGKALREISLTCNVRGTDNRETVKVTELLTCIIQKPRFPFDSVNN